MNYYYKGLHSTPWNYEKKPGNIKCQSKKVSVRHTISSSQDIRINLKVPIDLIVFEVFPQVPGVVYKV